VAGVVIEGGLERGQQRLFILDDYDMQRFEDLDENKKKSLGAVPEDLRVTKDGRVWMLDKSSKEDPAAEALAAQAAAEGDDAPRKARTRIAFRQPRENIDFVFYDSGSELIPRGKHLAVHAGDRVHAGEKLCEGAEDPTDILRVTGVESVQEYLVTEIQKVYRLQGVTISDKHIECIVRQMMRKVVVTHPGDTDFLEQEDVSKTRFRVENERMMAEGKISATCIPLLLGITRSSLGTDSFISAASFQETTKVLTKAAVEGSHDPLIGLKENVKMGRLIPSGTGAPHLRGLKAKDLDAEASLKEQDLAVVAFADETDEGAVDF